MPQFRFRKTFTRPDNSVEWPFKWSELEGTEWRSEEDNWFAWMRENRSEAITSTWVSENKVHVDVIFEDERAFDEYIGQVNAAGQGAQFETDSWQNIESTYGYTYTYSTGYV